MRTRARDAGLRCGLIVALLAVLGACHAPPPSAEDAAATTVVLEPAARFVGSWRLAAWTTADGADRCAAPATPHGQILYSADGHMSAQLGCTGTEPPAEPTSPEEARRQLTGRHFSYYGRYTVDPEARTVTHHVEGSVTASWVGEDRVRSYTFESDDRLVLDAGGPKLAWVRNRSS